MEQRTLRLGDLVDDYCPRERRITNHAIVAIVNDGIKQTRCTTCDTEHVFKGGKIPRRRPKDAAGPVDNSGGQLVSAARANGHDPVDDSKPSDVVEIAAAAETVDEVVDAPAEAPSDPIEPRHEDMWPGNRRLIRATLPKVEGELPPPRPIPEFTMHQRPVGRGGGGFRHGRGWSGQGNGNGNGNGNHRGGFRGDGQPGNGNGFGQGQGHGRRRHGKRRPR